MVSYQDRHGSGERLFCDNDLNRMAEKRSRRELSMTVLRVLGSKERITFFGKDQNKNYTSAFLGEVTKKA